jgi:hypothetical protein
VSTKRGADQESSLHLKPQVEEELTLTKGAIGQQEKVGKFTKRFRNIK